jgi:hypothetical protein
LFLFGQEVFCLIVWSGAGDFLVETDEIAGGIEESGDGRGAAGRIGLRRGDDFGAVGCGERKSGGDIVNPDVGEEARFSCGIASGDPSAADVAGGVVEAGTIGIAMADIPGKDFFVECGGLVDIEGRNFEIAEARAAQEGDARGGPGNGGAPIGGTEILKVLGEKPVMAFEIRDAILAFAIDGDIEIFDDSGAGGFGVLKMGIDIVDEDGEGLRAEAELGGTLRARARLLEHDPGVAEMNLSAAGWIAVAVMLDETKGFGDPGDGSGEILIHDVGQKSVWRHRAIFKHGDSLGDGISERAEAGCPEETARNPAADGGFRQSRKSQGVDNRYEAEEKSQLAWRRRPSRQSRNQIDDSRECSRRAPHCAWPVRATRQNLDRGGAIS